MAHFAESQRDRAHRRASPWSNELRTAYSPGFARSAGGRSRRTPSPARWGLLWVSLGVALVSLGTPMVSELVYARWFDFPGTLTLMVLPAASVAAWAWVWRALGRSDWQPFAGAVAIFVLAFFGLAYSVFPYVMLG